MTHCTICGDPIPGGDYTDEAWCAGCFEVNLAYTLEPGQELGWQQTLTHWPEAVATREVGDGRGMLGASEGS